MSTDQATPTGRALRRRNDSAVASVLNVGPVAVLAAIALSVVVKSTALVPAVPGWLLPIAIVALALGVPHGAVDHLTLSRSLTIRQWITFGLTYALVAAAAAAAIIAAPVPGFVLVLVATIWHFGTGDLEATSALQGTPPEQGSSRIIHALALGCAPVLLPLTSPAAAATLGLIEPQLGQMVTPATVLVVRAAVFVVIGLALAMLVRRNQHRAALELVALTALGLLASPLLAFAVYFGLWHALRHTARLAQRTYGHASLATIGQTFRQGVPSLIGFVVVVGLLASRGASVESAGALMWLGLAIVWGLTIPHMALVSALDRRERRR